MGSLGLPGQLYRRADNCRGRSPSRACSFPGLVRMLGSIWHQHPRGMGITFPFSILCMFMTLGLQLFSPFLQFPYKMYCHTPEGPGALWEVNFPGLFLQVLIVPFPRYFCCITLFEFECPLICLPCPTELLGAVQGARPCPQSWSHSCCLLSSMGQCSSGSHTVYGPKPVLQAAP